MASVTPRASALWETSQRMSYFDGEGDIEDFESQDAEIHDGRTPLDRTIDRIGMGEPKSSFTFMSGT